MKRKLNKLLIFLITCSMCLPFFELKSQNQVSITKSDFQGEPLEVVSLQTDRDIYLAGESIWFSAFCSINGESTPSPISQIIYIEVYNAAQKVFVREKFKLQGGQTSGHLNIPEEVPSGYYFIRAYTMYLRNFAPENYYISNIMVIHPEIPQSGRKSSGEIIMAPAGGNLISGLPSQIAVKIPSDIVNKIFLAILTNTIDDHLDTIKLFPNGLGLIDFIPNDSTQYFMKLKFVDGDSMMVSIPASQQLGISVQTRIVENDLIVQTFLPESDKKNKSKYILKVLTASYFMKYETEININQHVGKTVIPLTHLPYGLSYVLVADENDGILSFNPVYIEDKNPDNILINLSRNTFRTREKVDLDFQLSPSISNDLKLLTVSVVKKGTVITNGENLQEIVIENPILLESYLNNIPFIKADLLDQVNISLMLATQKAKDSFQKYTAQHVTGQIYFPEIRDVSISGFLLDKKTKQPLNNVQMYASVLFDDFQLHTTNTKNDGSFVFALNHLTGKHNLYLFPDIDDGEEQELFIHNDFSPQFRDLIECFPIIDSAFLKLLDELYANQQISNNFPVESVVQNEVPLLSPWFGVEMVTIKLSDYINLTSFREVINEIVPSVRLKLNNDKYRFTIFDEKAQINYENPLVLLDNIPVTDINELVKIHPVFIDKIEVMNQPYILGDYTIWGLIMISTNTDNFGSIKLPKGSAFINYQTLKNTSLYIPLNFNIDTLVHSSNPFFNTVLYWNPGFKNDNAKNQISFYTSDRTAEYDVIISGIHADGRPFTGIDTFIVTDE